MTLLSRLHYAVNIYRVAQKCAYYFCNNYTKSCCMSMNFGAWLVHSICSTKVLQLHTLPDWCFYTTLYNEPMHQLGCSIMSSFDYGQTALLRFVVEQVVQQMEVVTFDVCCVNQYCYSVLLSLISGFSAYYCVTLPPSHSWC